MNGNGHDHAVTASPPSSEQRSEPRKGWFRRWRGREDLAQPDPDKPAEAPTETPPESPSDPVPEIMPVPEEPTPADPEGPDVTPPGEPEIAPEREPGAPPPGAPEQPPPPERAPPELPPYPDRTPPEPSVPERTPFEPERTPEIEPPGSPTVEPGTPVEVPPPGRMSSQAAAVPPPENDASWLARLRRGLGRSSAKLTGGIGDLFRKRRLDDDALEELEDLLISADLGVATAAKLTASLAKSRFDQDVSAEEVRTALADEAARILKPVAETITIHQAHKPHVILVCGVNGSGKTTTIAKLGGLFKHVGFDVVLAAGDTFRAAAVEQLQIWGDRIGAPVIARPTGSDAAGLAFDAFQQARARRADVLIIDTAGRLQNRGDLMNELQKIVRALKKADEKAPHDTILVLDATVGQNAHSQVETFRDMVKITGLVMTKLDGSAKGGVVVALADKFGLPVHAVGVGETLEDMRPFDARSFARSLMGLSPD